MVYLSDLAWTLIGEAGCFVIGLYIGYLLVDRTRRRE